ncbi:hypothetical protein B0J11DRAFT_41441 [Dendryphion nanum]|uniref:C2H2-type domain-containing protein n=1 Tax=Dendryphion nanum TaxID=256645 RepID=A0A9P9IZ97_9PLEO|nr:hypothetical protein B0J11DRAFT_41441 [Dendryphion nanum]
MFFYGPRPVTSTHHLDNNSCCLPPNSINFGAIGGPHMSSQSQFNQPRESRARVSTIKEWLYSHSSSPYPSKDDISNLASATGKTPRQVKVSLSNLRSRMSLPGMVRNSVCPQNDGSISSLSNVAASSISPQTESVNSSDIDFFLPSSFIYTESNDGDIPSGMLGHGKLFPAASSSLPARATKRKGRRLHASRFSTFVSNSLTNMELPTQETQKIYHCTICPKTFKDSSGWQRHESGVHFHTTQWICMLNGAVIDDLDCAFCSELFPDPEHQLLHNIPSCLFKSLSERTFYRKDQLKQHIQQIHIPEMDPSTKKAFRVPAGWAKEKDVVDSDPRSLWCGFCRQTFPSTTERMEHVADHFRNGFHINQWQSL